MVRFLLLLTAAIPAFPADWLTTAGDRDGSRWQRDERSLKPSTASKIQLLWKRKLDDGPLSGPVILGQMKTHRGKIELVFVNSASGTLYAVDGDFSTIFWTRKLGGRWPDRGCGPSAGSVTPRPADAPPEDEEDDDAPVPLRPLEVLAADGRMHSIHPGVGTDTGEPKPPVPLPATCAGTPARADGWVYSTARGRLEATRAGKLVWSSASLPQAKPPVVAGGLVFVLAAPAVLRAFDATSGTLLYSSGTTVSAPLGPGGLAVANGHVMFTAGDGVLYCFGIPEER